MDRTWCSVGCRHQLAAKPIIDMLVVVDSVDEDSYVPLLQAVGYPLRIREPDWHQPRLLSGPPPRDHLHVFSVGSPEIYRCSGFAATSKRRLASRQWEDVRSCADAKSNVIETILARTQPVWRDLDVLSKACALSRPGLHPSQ